MAPPLPGDRVRSGGLARRAFLSDLGMGFTGLVLGSMLHDEGITRAATLDAEPRGLPTGQPHFPPRAKRVIWLFMIGGASHLETFDPKPALNQYAGKTITETPFPDPQNSPYAKENLRELVQGLHHNHPTLFPLQVAFQKRGQAGIEVSDWWEQLGQCVDDLSIVRSMWTTDNNHGAQLQFHTGRHVLEGFFPTIGSWVHYGLGTLNADLPQFIVLGTPIADCCGGNGGHGASYLGPEHNGVSLAVDPREPIPFARPTGGTYREEQAAEFELLRELGGLAQAEYPDDAALRARIRSYELAFRMQTAVPEVFAFDDEPAYIHSLYGLDADDTRVFGQQCLAARRLVERGVRFVQIFHGSNGGAGAWDAHGDLQAGHARLIRQTDRPIAALLRDLKQRGLLEDTLLVWATEFGRTPGAQNSNGRDHHPYGFSVWLAGGGIRGGVVHGATDELGYHAVADRHYVTDVHATVLHQLGLDPRRLEVPGRKRLELDYGRPIQAIIG